MWFQLNEDKVMKKMVMLSLAVALSVLSSNSFAADVDLTNIKCPISGKQAVAEGKIEYKGKTVYACCTNCPKTFAKSPEKFAVKANAQLVATKQAVQVACPISGKPVDAAQTVDVAGVAVAFCCKNCRAKVADATGDAQLALVFENFDKGFTTQTECPVSGKPINPAQFSEKDGKKTYYCCEKCKPKE
jgi:YHS domain-containing protein